MKFLGKNLGPKNPSSTLGDSTGIWGEIRANKWFPKAGDDTIYIEFNATQNCFIVHGTIMATGNVVAGQ